MARSARVLIALAVIAAVSLVAARLVRQPSPERPGGSPVDTRQREILRAAIDRAGDPALTELYDELNTQHFNRLLPPVTVSWEPRLAEVGALAGWAFELEGMFGRVGRQTAILLHPKLKGDPEALRRTLSHEAVHAYLDSIGDESTGHGPAFQAALRRLSVEGAFTGIVADDEERLRLKAWLDAEADRLAAEDAFLAREGAALADERAALERMVTESGGAAESPSAVAADFESRRLAYNARVEAAEARADRGRDDVETFNREAERYNLMLVYPDGLDEEAMYPGRPERAQR